MRVAIADSDPEIVNFLKEVVDHMGHRTAIFHSGLNLLTQLQRDTFDLLILNWNLPDRSGSEVLIWVADNLTIPPAIMVVTAGAEEEEITTILHAGADDVLMIPAPGDVAQARIAALLRRSVNRLAPPLRPQQFGRYCFDRQNERASFDDELIVLTSKEFALAWLFFQNPHRALSRAYILDAVWNSVAGLPSRTLDVHVARIRSKLRLKPENGYGLLTIFGFGYRLERFEG